MSWDVSAAKDEKIMSYLIKNDKAAETEEDTYTLYIQGNNGIEASPNSKYLFFNFSILESIEGLEYLDTSQVTNMASMFYGCNNLQSLDISSFDTSNVTSMSGMFNGCQNIISLDLSHFNTSNVTAMSSMFWNCKSLTTLDLSNFDTIKVTDMGGMFGASYNLTYLDISNFDTRNVTKFYTGVYGMFGGSNKLETIVYGENFIKKEGADTTKMFTNCPANKPTHESWNGVF